MTTDIQQRILMQMQPAWEKTATNIDDNPPPPGEYEARVASAAVVTTGSNGESRVKLKITYQVLQASYSDRSISSWLPLDDPDKLTMAKSLLARLNVSTEDLTRIPQLISAVIGSRVVIEVKQSGDYTNAYLQRVLNHETADGVIKESVPAGGNNDIPF